MAKNKKSWNKVKSGSPSRKALLHEISRANWKLINDLKELNEEIAEELANTYSDGRELGQKLKNKLIQTEEELRQVLPKAKLPKIYSKKAKILKTKSGKLQEIEKTVVKFRFGTPLDGILSHNGVATSLWNVIKRTENPDYWLAIVREARAKMGYEFERQYGTEYFDRYNPYDDYGNGSTDHEAGMQFLENLEQNMIVDDSYEVDLDEDSVDDIVGNLQKTYRDFLHVDARKLSTNFRDMVKEEMATGKPFKQAFEDVIQGFHLAAQWSNQDKLRQKPNWTIDKIERARKYQWVLHEDPSYKDTRKK